MTALLALFFPSLPDVLPWLLARHRWALVPVVVAASGLILLQVVLTPFETMANIRANREKELRRKWIREQTDSLYPLW